MRTFLSNHPKSLTRQGGAALILIMFILGLGIAAYMIKAFNAASERARQDEKTVEALGEAKKALIAWAVSNPNQPGMMPFPDRKETSSPNYDGKSDCYQYNLDGKYDKLIGNLPWLAVDNAGCNNFVPSLGREFKDSSGEHLWYAVSRNLVYSYVDGEYPVINPGMINSPYSDPPYLRQGHATAYPWFEVYDANGVLLSDRVAAVIIAPGGPVGNQNRSGVAEPDQYLDVITMAGGTAYENYGYPSDNLQVQKYIVGESENNVSETDARYQHPYYFNDKLVYITIDELMAALEKRVAAEAESAIKTYVSTNGNYPYAAQLGSTSQYACEPNKKEGFLPLDNQVCTYTVSGSNTSLACRLQMFDAEISGITEVKFSLPILNSFLSKSGNCSITSLTRACSCTGLGSCSNSLTGNSFSCDGEMNCSSVGANGTYTIEGGRFQAASAACSITAAPTKTANSCTNSNSIVSCEPSGGNPSSFSSCGDASFGDELPVWFRNNHWQDYIYYTTSRNSPGNIAVGKRTSVEALLIATGGPIDNAPYAESLNASQARPSCNLLSNYLDSTVNVSPDAIYELTSKTRSSKYNDQLFIVAP